MIKLFKKRSEIIKINELIYIHKVEMLLMSALLMILNILVVITL